MHYTSERCEERGTGKGPTEEGKKEEEEGRNGDASTNLIPSMPAAAAYASSPAASASRFWTGNTLTKPMENRR